MQEELEELDKTDKVSAALQEYVSDEHYQFNCYSMVLVLENHLYCVSLMMESVLNFNHFVRFMVTIESKADPLLPV
jgi:hypothetical protein